MPLDSGGRISEARALEPPRHRHGVGMIRVCRRIIEDQRSRLKDKTPRPIGIGRRLADKLVRRIA